MRLLTWLSLRRRVPLVATLLVAIVVGLVAGFLFGYGLATGHLPALGAEQEPPAAAPVAHDYPLLDEIRGLIHSEYLRAAQVESDDLVHGAARGMVQALDDPNSVYESPEERKANESRWTGRYEGVGIMVDQKDGLLVVTAPIEGGPAAKAGVLPGDIILEADGRSLRGLTISQQSALLRGPKGTSVELTIRRDPQPGSFKLVVVRDEVKLISARSRMRPDGLAVLRISQFTEQTAEEARSALDSVLATRPSGLLLDLRGDPGGMLEPAVQATGFFLGPGPVVLETRATGEQKTYSTSEAALVGDLPIELLVDRGTASAAEVMAAALRDRGRVELLGEKTYGKSTVQYIHQLSDGSGLRLTVAQWHTPSGQPIPATGLVPDVLLEGPLTPREDNDPVLEQAAQRLLARVPALAR
jgi:carboxyl-terminal processing protease